MTFLNGHQIPLAVGTIANEALVTRARNVLGASVRSSDYTHLLFIDADIEFQVEDVLKLYHHDKDVVVGAYPKKGVAWDRIRSNMNSIPLDRPLSDKEIASFGSDYAINFKFLDRYAQTIAVENGIITLHAAATGFTMIKREVILKLITAYPALTYTNADHINTAGDLHYIIYVLFDTMIDPIDKRYLSEDYTFCRRWQEMGGDIWLDPSISLNHYGHFCFQGNPQAIIQFGDPQPAPVQKPLGSIKVLDLPDEIEQPA